MIAKATEDAGSLERLSLPELLELIGQKSRDLSELLSELKRRNELSLERDAPVRTDEELGLTEPYPDLGRITGL